MDETGNGFITRCHDVLVRAFNERFVPPNQTELCRAQPRERTKKATESLPEIGQSVRRLTNLTYPTKPYDVRQTNSCKRAIF